MRALVRKHRAAILDLVVERSSGSHELHRVWLHPLVERFHFRDFLRGGEVAYLLGGFHSAEVGAAHGAEMGGFGAFLGQGCVVERLGFAGFVDAQVGLVRPAELLLVGRA